MALSTVQVPALVSGGGKQSNPVAPVSKLPADIRKYIKQSCQTQPITAQSSVEVLEGVTPQAAAKLAQNGAPTLAKLASLSELNPEAYRYLTSQVARLEELSFSAVVILSVVDNS